MTILTGVDPATLQQWLTDAQVAYASLMSGASEVRVKIGERDATYSSVNESALRAWITSLQVQLGIIQTGRRAVRVGFR